MSQSARLVFLISVPLLLVGCESPGSTSGGDLDAFDTGIQTDSATDVPSNTPALQVTLDEVSVAEDGSVTLFESHEGDLRTVANLGIANAGAGTIRVVGVAIASTPPGALRLEPLSSTSLPSPINPAELTLASSQLRLSVVFEPPGSPVGSDVRAAITLAYEDATSGAADTFAFHLLLSAATPTIAVDPNSTDFGQVATGQTVQRTISILNLGEAPLEVTGFSLSGHPGFALSVRTERWSTSQETASGLRFSEPLVVAPAHVEEVTVYFEASGSESARAELTFNSNDTNSEDSSVDLVANHSGVPCLSVDFRDVTFPPTTLGQASERSVVITACDGVLLVSNIAVLPGSSQAFTVSTEGLGPFPISLAPSGKLEVPITFAPVTLGSHTGTLRINSNSFIAEFDVALSGTSSN